MNNKFKQRLINLNIVVSHPEPQMHVQYSQRKNYICIYTQIICEEIQ